MDRATWRDRGPRAFPVAVAKKRKRLEERIKRHGFEQTMEALAYTWFNRLVAIRFMELHGYLDHGYRVLSHPEGKPTPEILEHAEHVELPGLNRETVIDLKLDGNKEAELYRLLLIAQCNALHYGDAVPLRADRRRDGTAAARQPAPLRLADPQAGQRASTRRTGRRSRSSAGSTSSTSRSGRTRSSARVSCPREDIPAATQLFTPNWIVRYLVENTLGRLWLLNRPGSRLREQMPYYIAGDAETDFLKITKPEEIKVTIPPCGSGTCSPTPSTCSTRSTRRRATRPARSPA